MERLSDVPLKIKFLFGCLIVSHGPHNQDGSEYVRIPPNRERSLRIKFSDDHLPRKNWEIILHHFASFPESPKSTGNSQNPGDKSPRSPASELMPKLGTLCAAFLPWTEPATWLPFPWPFPWRLGDEKLEGPLAAPKMEKNGECRGNLSFNVVETIWNNHKPPMTGNGKHDLLFIPPIKMVMTWGCLMTLF